MPRGRADIQAVEVTLHSLSHLVFEVLRQGVGAEQAQRHERLLNFERLDLPEGSTLGGIGSSEK
ncbi:hypothetical protein D7193_11080 [Micromonospora costi]|uniref:Uncharacterized protein n=1 Tax=Micromonospora costi TaxID=1530042 RepID=A0A3B0A427_9ACTN|nr:hypothetical protein D7193_11080 [Micromonospora costi]